MTVDLCWSVLMSSWGSFDLWSFRLSTGKVPFSRSLSLQHLLCHVQQSSQGFTRGLLLYQQKKCCFMLLFQINSTNINTCFQDLSSIFNLLFSRFPSFSIRFSHHTIPHLSFNMFQLSLPWPRSVTPSITQHWSRVWKTQTIANHSKSNVKKAAIVPFGFFFNASACFCSFCMFLHYSALAFLPQAKWLTQQAVSSPKMPKYAQIQYVVLRNNLHCCTQERVASIPNSNDPITGAEKALPINSPKQVLLWRPHKESCNCPMPWAQASSCLHRRRPGFWVNQYFPWGVMQGMQLMHTAALSMLWSTWMITGCSEGSILRCDTKWFYTISHMGRACFHVWCVAKVWKCLKWAIDSNCLENGNAMECL